MYSIANILNMCYVPFFAKDTMTLEVTVRDNNLEQALRSLKKKMQREGLYREMKLRKHYEKPSLRRAREKAESIRRFRKMQRRKMDGDS